MLGAPGFTGSIRVPVVWVLAFALGCSGDPNLDPPKAAVLPVARGAPLNKGNGAVGTPSESAPKRLAYTPTPIAEVMLTAPVRRAASPASLGEVPEILQTRAILDRWIRSEALDPSNPWAVKHAMLVYGGEVRLTDGRPAVEALFQDFAEVTEVDGNEWLDFPTQRSGDVRIEPHTDLLLKGLVHGGILPGRQVRVKGKVFHLTDLYRHSLWKAWVVGEKTSGTSWDDTPWTLMALATWAPPHLAWVAEGDREMNLDLLTHEVVTHLHAETQFLRNAMARGEKFRKQKQGIFAYTCGGAHLLQGAAYAVARGFGGPDDRRSVEGEVPALFFRFDLELAELDQAIAVNPDFRPVLLAQRLKFTGHFLEVAHELAALGLYRPDMKQQQTLKRAAAEVVATVAILDRLGLGTKLHGLKNGSTRQLYLDYVGDACHAAAGLDYALGRRQIRF